MVKRSNADFVARKNNATWDTFYAIRKVVLEETNSEVLKQIVSRKYSGVDPFAPSKFPGIDGKPYRGAVTWVDFTIPPSIVADVRKALPKADVTPEIKKLLADLILIYQRLQDPNRDHAPIMANLRRIATEKWNGANVINF